MSYVQLLPFEVIVNLKNDFRETVVCNDDCPRMCKSRFKVLHRKGFGLGDIYNSVSDSTEILSILMPEDEELGLMAQIMGVEDDLQYDMIVDGWMTILENGKKILWRDLLEVDLAHRNNPTRANGDNVVDADAPVLAPAPAPALDDHVAHPDLREAIAEMSKAMMEGFKTLNGKVGEMDVKFVSLHSRIEVLEKSKSGGPFFLEEEFQNESLGRWTPRTSPIAKVIEEEEKENDDDKEGEKEDDNDDGGFDGYTGLTGFSGFTSNIFDSFVENVIHLGDPSVDKEEEERTEPHAIDDDVIDPITAMLVWRESIPPAEIRIDIPSEEETEGESKKRKKKKSAVLKSPYTEEKGKRGRGRGGRGGRGGTGRGGAKRQKV